MHGCIPPAMARSAANQSLMDCYHMSPSTACAPAQPLTPNLQQPLTWPTEWRPTRALTAAALIAASSLPASHALGSRASSLASASPAGRRFSSAFSIAFSQSPSILNLSGFGHIFYLVSETCGLDQSVGRALFVAGAGPAQAPTAGAARSSSVALEVVLAERATEVGPAVLSPVVDEADPACELLEPGQLAHVAIDGTPDGVDLLRAGVEGFLERRQGKVRVTESSGEGSDL